MCVREDCDFNCIRGPVLSAEFNLLQCYAKKLKSGGQLEGIFWQPGQRSFLCSFSH